MLVTGHTGFKGSWLSEILIGRGAQVFGLALPPDGETSLFEQLDLGKRIDHAAVDLRDHLAVVDRVTSVVPEIVFHLGAQSLVKRSYRQPVETWASNVMGTIHLMHALSQLGRVVPTVIVTTDKVYDNREWEHGYRETDALGGHDPYSASKAATELAVDSWRRSFPCLYLATARAGNVIGGGDWAEDRLLPDLVRAFSQECTLSVRNPTATRPFQHVLEPLTAYLTLAERLALGDPRWQTAYNFGPDPSDIRSVSELVDAAAMIWPGLWKATPDPCAPRESGRLSLTIDKARHELGWRPRWDISRGLVETVKWYYAVHEGADPVELTRAQIAEFEAGL